MPRSHKPRTTRRRRALPRSQSKRSGVPASTRGGAPATSPNCFRQMARAARRRHAAQPQAADDKTTTRTATLSKQEERGASVDTRRCTPTSPSCFRQLAHAARRAEMPRSRRPQTARRRCAGMSRLQQLVQIFVEGACRDAGSQSSGGGTTTHQTASSEREGASTAKKAGARRPGVRKPGTTTNPTNSRQR